MIVVNADPRDATLARYFCYRVSVHPSIRLVTNRRTDGHAMTANTVTSQTGTVPNATKCLVFDAAIGEPDVGGVGKNCFFRSVEKSPAQTPNRRKFVSIRHGGPRPRRCAGNTRCHQQHWW